MIVLCGPTGSGKTTTLKLLSEDGYGVIPVYTTRPARPDDFGTVHIEPEKFKQLFMDGEFVSTASFQATFGVCSFGFLKDDMRKPLENKVVIGALEYVEDFKKWAKECRERYFQVYLDVSDDTIVMMSRLSSVLNKRPDASADTISRLARDQHKNLELKKTSDLVINNQVMKLPPDEVMRQIEYGYMRRLGKGVKYNGETGSWDLIRQS